MNLIMLSILCLRHFPSTQQPSFADFTLTTADIPTDALRCILHKLDYRDKVSASQVSPPKCKTSLCLTAFPFATSLRLSIENDLRSGI